MDSKQIVRAGYAAHEMGDMPGLLKLLAENIEWVSPTMGRLRGRQAVRGYFERMARLFEIERSDATEFIAQGDTVVVLGAQRLRSRETGRTVEYDFAHVFTVEEERITRLQIYLDTAAVEAVLNESAAERDATLGPMGVTGPPL